jgi:nucleotide-binding universal stress UspA family protein
MQRDPHFRIVIALDLSEYAEIVLEYALDQAARHSAPDLHFLNVVRDEDEVTVQGAKQELARLVYGGLDNISRGPDWRARLHVRAGRPHEEIVSLAGELDAHLIVCGRFGARRTWRRLGSTAHRLVDDAHCPVLAVNLVDRPIGTVEHCPDCVALRAESDGERWFCAAHSAPDRETLATTSLSSSLPRTGGGLLW